MHDFLGGEIGESFKDLEREDTGVNSQAASVRVVIRSHEVKQIAVVHQLEHQVDGTLEKTAHRDHRAICSNYQYLK